MSNYVPCTTLSCGKKIVHCTYKKVTVSTENRRRPNNRIKSIAAKCPYIEFTINTEGIKLPVTGLAADITAKTVG